MEHLTYILVLVLAISCFSSFIWSILRFFKQECGMPARMKLVSVSGSISMVAHLIGLIVTPSPNTLRLSVCVIAYALSLTVFWWSLRTAWVEKLPIAFSAMTSRHVIREGPYRLVRHPIYLSYALAWCAGAVAITGIWPWLFVLLMIGQYVAAILYEERQFLAGEQRPIYHEYISRTGMVLPNPRKLLTSRNEK